MKREFKIGDRVYLKNEQIYKTKRIWKITDIRDDGVYILKRNVKSFFTFLEFAKADEIVLMT